MNAKLISAALLALVAGACDGNDVPGNDVPDTFRPDVTDTSPDAEVIPIPEVTENDGSVKAAQTVAESVTCDPAGFVDVNPAAQLKDVVVTSAKFDANKKEPNTEDGYYVADQDGGAYSGIVIRIPAAARPAADLVPGDVIDVTGQLKEVFCLTQLEAVTITKKGTGTPPAAVQLASAADAANEAYESMLVKVSGVTIEAASAQGGRKLAGSDVGVDFAIATGFISLDVGGKYDLTGIMGYSFSKWQLQPRSAADVILIEAPPSNAVTITSIQSAEVSKTCKQVDGKDANFNDGVKGVSIEGVVTVGKFVLSVNRDDPNKNLDGYIVSDGSQAPYSSLVVAVPVSLATNFVIGDQVKVTGDHQEFFCLTEFKAATITKTGIAVAPAPLAIDKNPADIEQYEGMLVTLNNVSVTGDDGHGGATTDAGFVIGNIIYDGFTAPPSGTTLTSVTGIVFYSYGMFRILPRSAADLIP